MTMRFLPVNPNTMLVELDDLAQTLALFDALRSNPVAGIAEIIPAARTLMIRTDYGVNADASIAGKIQNFSFSLGTIQEHNTTTPIEIPVSYNGDDLDDVANIMEMDRQTLIDAHQAAIWQVAFCGFAPGFAYLISNDERFDVPRRQTPRTRIPSGSLALGGRFCGIYPQETPGGWQIIGHSDMPMWDIERQPPALMRPCTRCRFVERKADIYPSAKVPRQKKEHGLNVISTPLPLLFQDEGRRGQSDLGLSTSGAMDVNAMHRANRAVGNYTHKAVLEITLGPVHFKADQAMVLALTGAGEAHINGTVIAKGQAFAVDAGDTIIIEPPTSGMRSYLAARGGFKVAPILHSASYDTLAHIGPEPIITGDVIALAYDKAEAVGYAEEQPGLPKAGDTVEIPVTLGPRTDWFCQETIERFLQQKWLVTAQSSRVGIRLSGDEPLLRQDKRELPSEGTAKGAIQIPHSGQPVIFLADHPLTGGYPVIATVCPQTLDLTGQIPAGAFIRFTAKTEFTPIIPVRP